MQIINCTKETVALFTAVCKCREIKHMSAVQHPDQSLNLQFVETEGAFICFIFVCNEVLISCICVCLCFEQKKPEYTFNNNFVHQVKDTEHVKSSFMVQYVTQDKKNYFKNRFLSSLIMAQIFVVCVCIFTYYDYVFIVCGVVWCFRLV